MSYFLYVSVNYFSGSSILFQKPQIMDLNRYVIPKIAGEWEDLAYALYFDMCHLYRLRIKTHVLTFTMPCFIARQ